MNSPIDIPKEDNIQKSAINLEADEIEDDDDVNQIPRDIAQQNDMIIKEISAPYSLPHYPIELEEQKKIAAQAIVLKELEERATHDAESINFYFSFKI